MMIVFFTLRFSKVRQIKGRNFEEICWLDILLGPDHPFILSRRKLVGLLVVFSMEAEIFIFRFSNQDDFPYSDEILPLVHT